MIIFDHRQCGLSHCQINAFIIKNLVNSFFNNEKFYFFSEKEHYKEILNIYRENNINIDSQVKYFEIEVMQNIAIREYNRFYSEIKILLKILIFAIKNKETTIISLYTSVWQLYIFILFSYIFKDINFYSVMHGELERINLYKFKKKPLKYFYHLFFGIFIPLCLPVQKNFKYIVLGESIRKNLLLKKAFLEKNIISIDHGYIFQEKSYNLNYLDQKIRFGIFGMIFKDKNGNNLIELLEKLDKIPNKNFEINLIGHIRDYDVFLKLQEYNFVKIYAPFKCFLDNVKFKDLAEKIDYALFTYDNSLFKLTASGAFWDPISFCKPIITLRNDYFNYYFNKYNNIGYILDTIDELLAVILKIIDKPDREAYKLQIDAINNLREDITTNTNTFYEKIFNI